MGYLQDKLVEALGLQKVMNSNSSASIVGWSPNNFKAIIIAKNYILVVRHLGASVGCVKKYDLDMGLVEEDLNNIQRTNMGKAKLNSILMKRSFSCLEEIYVDTLYMSFPSVINLADYVQEMMKSTSRLRYFGYGDLPMGGLDVYLNKAYQSNVGNYDYAIGTDKDLPINLNARGTGNEKWYSKYLLRPTNYRLDSEKGNLSIHFRKFEKEYEEFLKGKESETLKATIGGLVHSIAEVDKANEDTLHRVDAMLQVLSKGSSDRVSKQIFDAWRKVLATKKPFEGLKLNYLDIACGDDDYIRLCYNRYGIVYKGDKDINKDLLAKEHQKGRGFLDIYGMLDALCVEIASELLKEGKRDMVGLAITLNANDIPKGEFRKIYMKDDNGAEDVNGFFSFISDIIGSVV